MEGVILVAGQGKRMNLKTPKPLLEKNGKTVLEHIVGMLNKNGVNDITLKVGDRKEFDNLGYKTIKNLKDYKPKGDYVLSTGDTMIGFDLKEMYCFHKRNNPRVTVLTHNFEIPYGVVSHGNWMEKPKIEIAVGMFIVSNNVRGNSIQDLVKDGFITYRTASEFTHLTTQEDYEKWRKS